MRTVAPSLICAANDSVVIHFPRKKISFCPVKYTKDLMKKFNMAELKPVSTPMSSAVSLGPDEDGEAVD
jgi:hypothetical protein